MKPRIRLLLGWYHLIRMKNGQLFEMRFDGYNEDVGVFNAGCHLSMTIGPRFIVLADIHSAAPIVEDTRDLTDAIYTAALREKIAANSTEFVTAI